MKRKVIAVLLALLLLPACGTLPQAGQPEADMPTPVASTEAPTPEQSSDKTEASERIELVLATVSDPFFSGLSALISEFNTECADYRLVVTDYSEGGKYDAETARMRLNVDLGSGKCPDLLYFSDGLSPYTFVKHGYLEDLLPYLDSDDTLDRDSLSVLKPFLINDGLYYLSQGFTLETGVGKYSSFGESNGWTLDEYFRLESTLPGGSEMLYNSTAESFISELSARYIRTAVDWETGTCDFDNAVFTAILSSGKAINESPEASDPNKMDYTYGPVRVANGTLIMAMSYCNNVGKLAFEEAMAGEKLSFIGWPSEDGSCGSDVYPYKTFAVFSSGENKAGCWEFIRFLLLSYPMENDNSFMPMYMPMLEQQLENAKTEAPKGGALMDDEDIERFLSLLGAVENAAFYDQTILSIIEEEAAAFLAGDCSAEAAAKNVQSRASLYISEQG